LNSSDSSNVGFFNNDTSMPKDFLLPTHTLLCLARDSEFIKILQPLHILSRSFFFFLFFPFDSSSLSFGSSSLSSCKSFPRFSLLFLSSFGSSLPISFKLDFRIPSFLKTVNISILSLLGRASAFLRVLRRYAFLWCASITPNHTNHKMGIDDEVFFRFVILSKT